MIVEQRTYTLAPGKLTLFLAAYEEQGLPVHLTHFERLVGCFTTESGKLNQVVHLWAFDSHDERAKRRAAVQQDPRWAQYLERVKGFVLEQESRFLSPTPWCPAYP